MASGSAMATSFGAIRTIVPSWSCSFRCVFSDSAFRTWPTIQNRDTDAQNGPGYFASGWKKRAYTIQTAQ
jgi:hypothetical protein